MGEETSGTAVVRGPSSAAAAHCRQQYYAAGPFRPVPDKYALVTDERISGDRDIQTNRQAERQHHCVNRKAAALLRGLHNILLYF